MENLFFLAQNVSGEVISIVFNLTYIVWVDLSFSYHLHSYVRIICEAQMELLR